MANYVPEQEGLKEASDEVALAPNYLTVIGTVVCGQNSISGKITGAQEPLNYTAGPCS